MQSRNLLWGLYHPTDYKTGKDWTARFGSLAQNNLYYDKEWENSSNTLKLTANETLIINILPELNIRSVFSYDNTQTKDHIYYSRNHYNGLSLGTVTEIQTRAPRSELEREAKRVVEQIPKMVPGKQRERPVIVQYILPIIFSVQ